MSTCARHEEVVQAIRAGHWPQGCEPELQQHVAACEQCGEQVRIQSAFATARGNAMRVAPLQSAQLLWWKAQLRRRHEAMERLERPGLTLRITTLTACIVLLAGGLATMWKQTDWSRPLTMFSSAGWHSWAFISSAILLGGLIVVAVVMGLSMADEQR